MYSQAYSFWEVLATLGREARDIQVRHIYCEHESYCNSARKGLHAYLVDLLLPAVLQFFNILFRPLEGELTICWW